MNHARPPEKNLHLHMKTITQIFTWCITNKQTHRVSLMLSDLRHSLSWEPFEAKQPSRVDLFIWHIHRTQHFFFFYFYSEKFIRNFYDNRSLVTVAFDHYNFQHRKISGTKWINERKKKPQSKWVWGSWLGFLFIRNCIRLIDGSSKTDHIITQRACIHRTQINGHANFQFLIWNWTQKKKHEQ